jgi:predicted transcriptional regulator
MNSLNWWLRRYYQMQDNIVLVYRPTLKSWWNDRTTYLSSGYVQSKKYNHRSILDNEVVIEFDEEDKNLNLKLANEVCKRLKADGISFAKWDSGNKSIHVHCLVDVGEVNNLPLLKKVFMRFYSRDLKVLPDLRLASPGHLVRAEWGVHEKTDITKTFISRNGKYPIISKIPQPVWQEYYKQYNIVLKRKTTSDVNSLSEHPALKFILTSEKFRVVSDLRERSLFMLIHVLKPKYNDKMELVKFLQDWYKYSGGYKLSEEQVESKVLYHWNRSYSFGRNYLSELLESAGLNIEDFEK